MELGALSALEWLALAEHELLLFAGVFFLLGALDEFAMDVTWLWLRLTGRLQTGRLCRADLRHRELSGPLVVFIPAWQEAEVIGHTLSHALKAWPQNGLKFYIGCYCNDPATVAVAKIAAGGDPRVRIVVHENQGPTTKADCLNRLYSALEEDERQVGEQARTILLHDAEDLVDEGALALIDMGTQDSDFVQIPVLPLQHPKSRWIASHYCDEFVESHGKAMVVRDHLKTSLPAAGVGCAFARSMLAKMAAMEEYGRPFSDYALTEDYELGLKISAMGGRSRFLRMRGEDGSLIATRSYFPETLGKSVRQKARWIHGIAFQGWDRLGWGPGWAESWMRLRDRRGPFAAIVLFVGYSLLILTSLIGMLEWAGYDRPWQPTPTLWALLAANMFFFVWRAAWRFAFTAREYGLWEGLRSILRIPLSNMIAILAGRRALFAYVRTFRGDEVRWDKTVHDQHPTQAKFMSASQ